MGTTTHHPAPERARLLDIAAGCDYLGGVSRAHVYDLIRRGELAVVKLGRRTMLDRRELDRFIDERAGA